MRLSKLFSFGEKRGSASKRGASRIPTPPPDAFAVDRLVYAVGDIHGRHDLLTQLLSKIEDDAARTRANREVTTVFVGDYVDRGPASAQVVAELEGLRTEPGVELVFLMGNHERAMLDFIANPIAASAWLRMGGIETVKSFGVRAVPPGASEEALTDCADRLNAALGSSGNFLRNRLVLQHQIGNVHFCHAAVDRELPLDEQSEDVLLWGSQRFLEYGGPRDNWIIHGHTISAGPERIANRIGIDTGAYMSGKLTAARIDSNGCTFLTAGRE